VGSNALLKPVVFVKAGTLFKEGDVAVVVRDEAREEEENQGQLELLSFSFPSLLSDLASPTSSYKDGTSLKRVALIVLFRYRTSLPR